MPKNRFQNWVNNEVSKDLFNEPFSSLPLKTRIGLLLLLLSYIIGYVFPPIIIFIAGTKNKLVSGLVQGSIFYLTSWVIGITGLLLSGKNTIKFPVHLFAKFIKRTFPKKF